MEDDFKSQYFDAQETLSEEEEDEEEENGDEYTDIEEEEEEEEGKAEVSRKRRSHTVPNMKKLPLPVQKRVKALKKLLKIHKHITLNSFKAQNTSFQIF